jgi:hypothetical protein
MYLSLSRWYTFAVTWIPPGRPYASFADGIFDNYPGPDEEAVILNVTGADPADQRGEVHIPGGASDRRGGVTTAASASCWA